MKRQKWVKEIMVLRCLACLSIVLLHSIEQGYEGINESVPFLFDSLHLVLYYGTPLFVFISEFILAYSYRNRDLPKGFWKKRIRYILIPYLIMATFYALPYMNTWEEFSMKWLMNVFMGDFHGYFILIIFQFYILHMLFHRYLVKWSPKYVLGGALILNLVYLAFFNFTEPYLIPHGVYLWERFSWIPFIGWIYYFVFGFYCGHYYESFIRFLHRYQLLIMAGPLVSSLVLLFLYHQNIIVEHSSKRIDLLFHTTTIGCLIFYLSYHIQQVPDWVLSVSRYSFAIYLLHMFYLSLMDWIVPPSSVEFVGFYIIFMFFGSTLASVFTAYHLNRWKYGRFVVGKIDVGYASLPVEKPRISIFN